MIEPWSWFRHFVKGHPQFPEKLESGIAVVERRTKTNSRNVGVAARPVPFVNKARANIYAA
jgi:hypothetical protein